MDWSQLFRWMMLKPSLRFSFGWCLMPGLVSATHQGATRSPSPQGSAGALLPARLPHGALRRPPGTGAWCLQVSTWFCWAKCWRAGLQCWTSALAKQVQTTGCHSEPLFLHSSPLFHCLLGPCQSFPWCYLNNFVPNTVFPSVFFSLKHFLKQVEPGLRVHQQQLAQAKECLHMVFWVWPEAEPYRIIACWLCRVMPASAFAARLSLKVAGSSSCLY